jgi:hypothetical protein
MEDMPPRGTIKDRAFVLAADLQSPRVVPAIGKALEENAQERVKLLDLRKTALLLHGGDADAPHEAPSEPVIQKNEPAGGTMATLVHHYRTDQRSPFHAIQHTSRMNYEKCNNRILEDFGDVRLADLKDANIRAIYEKWSDGGKVSRAHHLATRLRGLVHFGATALKDPECERLIVVLHNMRFKVEVKSRNLPMSEKHAKAIISKAHAIGAQSIALAQALQFDCKLPQKDVLGEWVPISEPGTSEEIRGKNKWLNGIRWSDIDDDLVLRCQSIRGRGPIEIDLKLAPLVMEELRRRGKRPSSGPVIVYEKTGRPYEDWQFRPKWRQIANAAGVPGHVKNMNSRVDADEDASAAEEKRESAR